MKATLIILVIGAVIAVIPQVAVGFIGPLVGGPPSSDFYQALLERDLQTLLATPDFPEDLAQRATDAVANAKTGFENCSNSTTNPVNGPPLQHLCNIGVYAAARNALSAIELEAQNRAAAAAAAEGST